MIGLKPPNVSQETNLWASIPEFDDAEDCELPVASGKQLDAADPA
jgi:hypothetical protein